MSKLEIDITELQKRKVMIATPMYGGQSSGLYTNSCIDLSALLMKYGIEYQFQFLFNESLITRARNYLADTFMRSPYTHLMFIDSDIGFNPHDVIAILAIAEPGSDKEIVCGPYPKKTIAWEKIVHAVNSGVADPNPNILEKFVGDYVFNPSDHTQQQIRLDEPVEVLESGTGFMMIQKSAFEKFDQKYPRQKYKPDHVRTKDFDGTREITAFFDAVIDDKNENIIPELQAFFNHNPDAANDDVIAFIQDKKNGIVKEAYTNRYLSEDYMFCQWARNAGAKTWLCPWIELKHTGTYVFGGSLKDLASIGAAATADVNKIGKKS